MTPARSSWLAVAVAVAVAVAAGPLSCGYTPVHAGLHEKLTVTLVQTRVPDAAATDEVLAGAREELARVGALETGSGFPRLEIEVLRADEASEGISASPSASGEDARLLPSARATRVGIVARGWVKRAKDGDLERDTGDMRAFETVAVAPDAREATFKQSDALRVAGRRVGRRLAMRVLGLPAAQYED
ncbi:MAG: hypothetical protein JST00_28910 [Deltaproteobacteria bacterium]|nr:hypothetical protein [Deltaproteobacteria bacterium]